MYFKRLINCGLTLEINFLYHTEGFFSLDPIFTMEWSSNTIKQVQQAFVGILVDVAPLQAHWYSICLPTDDAQVNNRKIT
jgi:hypothetical protein